MLHEGHVMIKLQVLQSRFLVKNLNTYMFVDNKTFINNLKSQNKIQYPKFGNPNNSNFSLMDEDDSDEEKNENNIRTQNYGKFLASKLFQQK